jgi:hypothetical protein
MKKLIGFANKYYTLWNYSEEIQYITDSYGNHHKSGVKQSYDYIKNISFDIDKVKEIHPNVTIDESLRGKSWSWSNVEHIDLPNNIFWGGKYRGKLIDEILVSDFGYCEWANSQWNSVKTYLSTHPFYLEGIAEKERQHNEFLNKSGIVTVGDVITINFTTNGYNSDEKYTECWVKGWCNGIQLNVKVNGVRCVDGMYPYLMPLVGGKCQRTKGKSFEVKVNEVYGVDVYGETITQTIGII